MKRMFAAVLVCILCIGALAGCTDSGSKNGVTVVRVWSGSGATKETMNKLIDEWNKTEGKKQKIEIEYSVFTSDFNTTLDASAQNDQLPELTLVPGGSNKEGYAKRGYIVPIDSMPGGKEFLEEYGEIAVEGLEKFDGKTYFVNRAVTTVGLVYNKDIFKKAGLVDEKGEAKAPETWEQVRKYAKIITEKCGKDIYGISIPIKDLGIVAQWMLEMPLQASFGPTVAKIDWDNQTYDWSDWEYALEWIAGIKKDNSFFPGAESLDNDTSRAQFAEGRIGMFIGASWDVGVLTTQFKANCDWGVAPVPVIEGKERLMSPVGLSSGFCITNNAKKSDPEKVMTVYKWLHSDEVQQACYEAQVDIPFRAQAVENAQMDNMLSQWAAFGSFVPETIERAKPTPGLKLEGLDYSATISMVWAGNMTPKEAVKEINKTYSDALKKGIKDGSIKTELYK